MDLEFNSLVPLFRRIRSFLTVPRFVRDTVTVVVSKIIGTLPTTGSSGCVKKDSKDSDLRTRTGEVTFVGRQFLFYSSFTLIWHRETKGEF